MTATQRSLGLAGLALLLGTDAARALDDVSYSVRAPNEEQREEMRDFLRDVSLISQAENDGRTEPQDLVATALADYTQLLEALYTRGYYSGVINITIDGREASEIALLDLPDTVRVIRVDIDTGPQFRFSRAEIGPLPSSRTPIPDGYARGEIAESTVIEDAVDVAIGAWREDSNAKARVVGERVIATHNVAELSSEIQIDPGPNVSFGNMIVTDPSYVRESAIRRIAGFPEGRPFHPDEVDGVLRRLRDTGAFSSVTLTEAETLGPGNTLDMDLTVADRKPRRIGFGAEVSTLEGGALNAFWLHRNLFGGAERFRVEGSVSNIGSSQSGMDYEIDATLQVPAIYGPRTDGFVTGSLGYLDEPTFELTESIVVFGATRELTENLELEVGVGLAYIDVKDDIGEREFFKVTFPTKLTYDRRSDELNPKQGFYIVAEAEPYIGLDDTQSGARLSADARYYLGFGDGDPNVLAARLQVGSVVGSDLTETAPSYLFYSGGGGTVRGQPYQSLNVDLGGGDETGGRGFLGASLEYRRDITENIGAVAFYDAGFIDADSFVDGDSEFHAGAGLGLRYQTGIGPIRFDVAAPTGGDTGEGVQFYIGIGQAF